MIDPVFLEAVSQEFGTAQKVLTPFFQIIWQMIKDWWWLPIPFILIKPFSYLWLWWLGDKWCAKNVRMILLEIKPPKEVLTPVKAMELVFSGLWHLYDPPNPREKWLDGKQQLAMSLEIASLGGKPHFYIRIPAATRDRVESSIYSQYPDVEIEEVEDYTKFVPQDIPNKNWDLWGCDYVLLKDDVYPIRTYSQFFEEKPEVAKEEKRIDPISALLEGMAKFKPKEQLWVQIIATPVVANVEDDYPKRGKKEVDKLLDRPGPKPMSKPIIQEAIGVFIGSLMNKAPTEEEKKEAGIIPPEMKLSPGERDVVSAIEKKVSKYAFKCTIRFVHLGKKEDYFGGRKTIPMGFFDQFSTTNFNGFKPWSDTITKKYTFWLWFLDKRRTYVRKRNMFRNYVGRISPLFPRNAGPSSFILNIEELASLYHFPGRMVTGAPSIFRVEAKRGEAPAELPIEE
jgi:hypothetical protein